MIYVKANLISSPISLETDDYEESVWVTVNLRNQDKLTIGCIYRSPNSNEQNNSKLMDLLVKLGSKRLARLLVVGDFNCKDINWENMTVPGGPNSIQAQLVQTIISQGWTQHVNCHTRFRGNNLPSLIDLVITNENNMIDNLAILNPMGKSDHGVLSFDYNCYGEEKPSIAMPKYYQGNYEAMREYLSNTTWNCSQETLDKNWNTIKKSMFHITEQFIPKRQTSDKEHKRWITKTAIQAIKMKHRARNKYNKSRNEESCKKLCYLASENSQV